MIRRRPARAVTLVEVMVAFLVAMLLFVVIWNLFSGGVRTFHTSQTHLEAMQVAQLVTEYVERDLHALILQSPTDPSVLASMNARSTLTFHVTESGSQPAAPGGAYLVPVCGARRVEYGLTACPGKPWSLFTRNGKAFSNLRLTRLEFRPVQVTSFAGRPHYYMQTLVTAVDGTGKKECSVASLVALELITRTLQGRHWSPNEYPYRRF